MPDGDNQLPPFLKRAAAAKARAAAQAAATKKPKNPAPQPDTKQPNSSDQTNKLTANGKSAPQTAEKARETAGNGRCDGFSAETDRSSLILAFETHSTVPAFFAEARPHLPPIWDAIIRGAKIPGAAGQNDRMTLFRMLGLPFTPTSGRAIAGAGDLSGVSQRLTSAVNRLEMRLGGQSPVTLDIEAEAEPVSGLARIGLEHMMADRVADGPGGSDAPAAAPTAGGSQGGGSLEARGEVRPLEGEDADGVAPSAVQSKP